MILYIKYMVSLRCRTMVKTELKELDLQYTAVDVGSIEMPKEINQKKLAELEESLVKSGFELLDQKNTILLDKLIKLIYDIVYSPNEIPEKDYQNYLSEKMGMDIKALTTLFTEVKCMTIKQFIHIYKMERVKEFLLYDEITIKEIVVKLNFKSVAMLTADFKKVTGLSLSFFRQLKKKRAILPAL